jgi:glycosyltransferase involved in cell wall biosynthesis
MVDQTKFTVIVPTRERSDTLFHCLQTLVRQNYENFEILVSDNFSQDNTEHVVRSIGDSRIRYINTGRRVGMSRNFEYALSHVKSGWVTYIGDDDGLMPNALTCANNVIYETGCKALAARHHYYIWPNFDGVYRRNFLCIRTGRGYRICSAKLALRRSLKGKLSFLDLPGVYRAFAEYEVLNRLRDESGNFFCSRTPDIYASIALLLGLEQYVYLNEPLSIAGASSHSIGHSHFKLSTNASASEKYYAEEDIPFHPALGDGLVNSAQLLVYEAFLQASHLGRNFDCTSTAEQLAISIAHSNGTRTGNPQDDVTRYCRKIAECQGIDFQSVKESACRIAFRHRVRVAWRKYSSPFGAFYVDGESLGLMNILDATVAAQATLNRSWRARKAFKILSYRLAGTLAAFRRWKERARPAHDRRSHE